MNNAVTLSSKGQVTIPKVIRDRLALKPGDRVVFLVRGEQVVLEAVGSIMDWYGAFSAGGPTAEWSDVRDQVHREVGRRTAAEGTPASAEEDAGIASG